MSVTIRPYVNGGWEVDIRVELPDGTDIRERKKAPSLSKTAAQRWAEARERVLLVEGKPKPIKKDEVQEKPTLREIAPRFIDGYAKANRLKPSGVAGKKSILSVHLIPQLGDRRLDTIQTEDVQHLKSALENRAPKTVNNVVLSVMLRTAVEWDVIERVPCVIKLPRTTKNTASFHDFDEYERVVEPLRLRQTPLAILAPPLQMTEFLDVSTNQRFLFRPRPSFQLSLALKRQGAVVECFGMRKCDWPPACGVSRSALVVGGQARVHVVRLADVQGIVRTANDVEPAHHRRRCHRRDESKACRILAGGLAMS